MSATPGGFAAILGFRLVTGDPDRLATFYEAIGFRRSVTVPIAPEEMATLGLSGRSMRTTLTLGPSRVALDRLDEPGAPYPPTPTRRTRSSSTSRS